MNDEELNNMSEEQWREKLDKEQYHVCREHGTERAFSGKYNACKEQGTYTCSCCGEALFSSDTKFDSGTGWPSFYQALGETAVESTVDNSHGMRREEVHCRKCGAHLGHVFPDGPKPTGQRYCINSVSLELIKD